MRVKNSADSQDAEKDISSGDSWTVPDRGAPPASAATLPLRAGAVLADRYDLLRVLGRGGMGVVFEARDRVLDETIAIKILRAEYAGERAWAERLAREVKLARQIYHPNVCRVFDFGEAQCRPFLTMEIAQRGTLRDELAKGEVLHRPVAERLADARALASGLAAIHAAGIIHRDVAPQNALRLDDGRLVLSDFGLATDKADGSTSVQGGTVAYMAPEVVRGGGASRASDLWSLGVVVHESIFGTRPRWPPDGREMLRPSLGRRLSDAERKAFDVCRACATFSPDQRPRSASRVADALTKGVRLSGRSGRLAALYAVAVIAVMSVSVALLRRYIVDRRGSRGAGLESGILRASADGEDWTAEAKILVTVPDRIRCMTLLPDRRTLRFIWGTPPRAEDLDSHTGRRVPAPLVPAAYAEGCPDVTRDGQKVVFAGHDRDLRPAAFVSSHPDGRDAIPVVLTGEPSLSTDPAWLPDNDSFLYPVDINHSAIFSVSDRTSVVVPADTHLAFSTGYQVVGDAVIVSVLSSDETTDLRRLRFPHLDQDFHARLERGALEMATPDGRLYYAAGVLGVEHNHLTILDFGAHAIRGSAFVANRRLRYPIFTEGGLTFIASSSRPFLVVAPPGGDVRRFVLPRDVSIVSACGDVLIGTRGLDRDTELVRLDWSGRLIGRLNVGHWPRGARCSSDGRVLYYQEWFGTQALMRCEGSQCKPIYNGPVNYFRLSPADDRIVALTVRDDGLSVQWLRADGKGGAHDIAKTDVACAPGWSSTENVWVAMRQGARIAWKEFVAATGKPTGATAPGALDCMDGRDDPQSPVRELAKVEWTSYSEVRLVSSEDLGRESTHSSQ